MPVRDSLNFIENLKLSEKDAVIAAQIIKEIRSRLQFLSDVGLDYLTLSRVFRRRFPEENPSASAWRHRSVPDWWVCSIFWTSPASVCIRRITTNFWPHCASLTDIGNTLIVVEHDEDTMYAADHIIDMGPGRRHSTAEKLVAQGTVEDIKACKESLTGQYLSGARKR